MKLVVIMVCPRGIYGRFYPNINSEKILFLTLDLKIFLICITELLPQASQQKEEVYI